MRRNSFLTLSSVILADSISEARASDAAIFASSSSQSTFNVKLHKMTAGLNSLVTNQLIFATPNRIFSDSFWMD